jgi:hypothetical protein
MDPEKGCSYGYESESCAHTQRKEKSSQNSRSEFKKVGHELFTGDGEVTGFYDGDKRGMEMEVG